MTMDQSTCSTPDCERPIQRRQWCNAHYRRLVKAGQLPPRTGTCEDCGGEYEGPRAGRVSTRCPACRRELQLAQQRAWMQNNYETIVNVRECAGCGITYEAPGRDTKSTHCADCRPSARREQQREYERAVSRRERGPKRDDGDGPWECLACGNKDKNTWQTSRRKFCRATCYVTWKRYDGDVPEEFNCCLCGVTVKYFDPLTRRRMRSDAAYCAACVRAARKYITAAEVAAEDGTECKLCGEPVDMTVSHPGRWSPTVDHIIPRARGGSDYRENLQLAHKGCNSSKRHYFIA